MRRLFIAKTIIGLCILTLSSQGFASGKDLPQGKPFRAIEERLRTLELRTADLLRRMSSLEVSAERNSALLELLNTETQTLRSLADALSFGMMDLQEAVSLVEAEINELSIQSETQIDGLGLLAEAIQSNKETITLLSNSTEESHSLLLSKINENQFLIGELLEAQSDLEEQLKIKQGIIAKTCEGTDVLVGISETGELQCATAFSENLIQIFTRYGSQVPSESNSSSYFFNGTEIRCANPIGAILEVPRQVEKTTVRSLRPGNDGRYSGYGFFGRINSTAWHPNYAPPGTEIFWKFEVKCLRLEEHIQVTTSE